MTTELEPKPAARRGRGPGRHRIENGQPKCLYPPCNNPPKCRGLCDGHYNTALRLIKKGQVSWDQLVAAGRANNATAITGGRRAPLRDWFLDAVAISAAQNTQQTGESNPPPPPP